MDCYPLEPKYRLGVPEMDAEHSYWIHLIEVFRASASDDLSDQQSSDAARAALLGLLEYTRLHFASEERFMAQHGFAGIAAHKQGHRKLESAVQGLLNELDAHLVHTTPLKLNLFVTIWLLEHIMQEDAKYARAIRAKAST